MTTEEIRALVGEAQEWAASTRGGGSDLLSRLADALEATLPGENGFDFGSACLWCDPDNRGTDYSDGAHAARHERLSAQEQQQGFVDAVENALYEAALGGGGDE